MTITRTVRVTRQKTAHPPSPPAITYGSGSVGTSSGAPRIPLRSQVHSPQIHQGGKVPPKTTARDLATLVGGAGLEPLDSSAKRTRSRPPACIADESSVPSERSESRDCQRGGR